MHFSFMNVFFFYQAELKGSCNLSRTWYATQNKYNNTKQFIENKIKDKCLFIWIKKQIISLSDNQRNSPFIVYLSALLIINKIVGVYLILYLDKRSYHLDKLYLNCILIFIFTRNVLQYRYFNLSSNFPVHFTLIFLLKNFENTLFLFIFFIILSKNIY